jgi:hypothetical protein
MARRTDGAAFSLLVPTNANLVGLDLLRDSLIKRTVDPSRVQFVLLDNANTRGVDLRPWVADFSRQWPEASIELLVAEERTGYSAACQRLLGAARNEYPVFLNDDVIAEPRWDLLLETLIADVGHVDCWLLTDPLPHEWSGWACRRSFLERYPFRTEFPGGYYEDDDLYLRVAVDAGLRLKDEVYRSAIYCLPYVEGRRLFFHQPEPKSPGAGKWDLEANVPTFLKHWRVVPPNYPGAVQNKHESQWFAPRKDQPRS